MTWGVMGYGLSVDVGTSFTAAAVLRTDGDSPGVPQILPLGSRSAAVPTVVYLGADGTRLVGEAAERRGAAQPECVSREFKRRMGDDVPLLVGGRPVLPQQLVAAVVGWVVGVATEREGGAPDVVTLTHPAAWGGHRTDLLRQALAEAGIGDVVLLTEPEAAALAYASRERVPAGSTLAVYDLGGGTFDATVLRKTDADTFTVLGRPQGLERLGGADFDQEIFDHVLGSPDLPPLESEPAPEVLAALARLRKECAEAKEALSSDSEATVSVMLPGAHSQVRLVRAEFEAMIEPALDDTLVTLRAALENAGVRAEELAAILLIGGSSRIPLVAQLLSEEFDRPLAIDVDPKASVALGAAFAASTLDAADGQEPAAAPDEEAGAPQAGPSVPLTNAAGFARPAPRPAAVPAHGPAVMAPNRRLGVRIAAVAAGVALLGIATASATNAPIPFEAFPGFSAGERAEAAEGTAPTEESGSTATAPGTEDGVEPDDTGETFLDTATEKAGTASENAATPSPSGKTTPSGKATDKGGGSSDATKRAEPTRDAKPASGKATPGKATSEDEAPRGGTKPTPPRTSTPSPTPPKPGTTPVDPTPPAPFPSPTPPAAGAPPTTAPPAPAPTTPPPAPDPIPDPPQPPADPTPIDPPPPADPEPQPTITVDAPATAAPGTAEPPPSEPITPSSATSEP
ncbi:molecular chaperone DnaK [Arthrobacter pityocampae]|uniref:Molecular chaperone DnaK n=1 Tax=Arthrobacter pityocampae TaxID=547334 RepID=A0A2S5IYD0_9MICC|nr:Hsp70 family protein [Arthrobacter pityocampae]PPB49602.1 molecular chaperone DnaK [Arthrobacter pityocampae]